MSKIVQLQQQLTNTRKELAEARAQARATAAAEKAARRLSAKWKRAGLPMPAFLRPAAGNAPVRERRQPRRVARSTTIPQFNANARFPEGSVVGQARRAWAPDSKHVRTHTPWLRSLTST